MKEKRLFTASILKQSLLPLTYLISLPYLTSASNPPNPQNLAETQWEAQNAKTPSRPSSKSNSSTSTIANPFAKPKASQNQTASEQSNWEAPPSYELQGALEQLPSYFQDSLQSAQFSTWSAIKLPDRKQHNFSTAQKLAAIANSNLGSKITPKSVLTQQDHSLYSEKSKSKDTKKTQIALSNSPSAKDQKTPTTSKLSTPLKDEKQNALSKENVKKPIPNDNHSKKIIASNDKFKANDKSQVKLIKGKPFVQIGRAIQKIASAQGSSVGLRRLTNIQTTNTVTSSAKSSGPSKKPTLASKLLPKPQGNAPRLALNVKPESKKKADVRGSSKKPISALAFVPVLHERAKRTQLASGAAFKGKGDSSGPNDQPMLASTLVPGAHAKTRAIHLMAKREDAKGRGNSSGPNNKPMRAIAFVPKPTGNAKQISLTKSGDIKALANSSGPSSDPTPALALIPRFNDQIARKEHQIKSSLAGLGYSSRPASTPVASSKFIPEVQFNHKRIALALNPSIHGIASTSGPSIEPIPASEFVPKFIWPPSTPQSETDLFAAALIAQETVPPSNTATEPRIISPSNLPLELTPLITPGVRLGIDLNAPKPSEDLPSTPQKPNQVTPSSVSPTNTPSQGVEEVPVAPKVLEVSPTDAPSPITPTAEATQPQVRQQDYLINFTNVNIIEYIRFISKITGKNFIFNNDELDFAITIVSDKPVPLETIMSALMQELRIHGFDLMEVGNNIIIHTNPNVKSPAKVVTPQNAAETLSAENRDSELITRIFLLNSLDPTRIQSVVVPLLSDKSVIQALPESSQLIVTDIIENVNRVAELIAGLDAPESSFDIGEYVVKNSSALSLITIAEKVLAPIVMGKTMTLVPHASTNSVYVISTPFLVQRALAILQQIDVGKGNTRIMTLKNLKFGPDGQPIQETPEQLRQREAEENRRRAAGELIEGGTTGLGTRTAGTTEWAWSDLPLGSVENTEFFIYKLQNRPGFQVADALKRIGDSLSLSATNNRDLVTTIDSVQWIEASNSLAFSGTQASLAKVKEFILEIDVSLREVFIEMLILDTSITNALQFGVNWATQFGGPTSAGQQSYAPNLNPVLNTLNNITSATTTIDPSPLITSTAFNIGAVGSNITLGNLSFNSIGALVSAVHNLNDVDIVLNPKLLVEDNVTAEIFVGDNIRFKTQSIVNNQGDIITDNFEFRDIGTLLRVTPHISNNNIVTLEIVQEVSQAIPGTAISNNVDVGPDTKLSRTRTKVHVPNNHFLVLSGMINGTNTKRRNHIPCLGGIPLIGAAFRFQDDSDVRRNLLIFIHPLIVDSACEMNHLTKRQQDVYNLKSDIPEMWSDEIDKGLKFLNIREDEEPCDHP